MQDCVYVTDPDWVENLRSREIRNDVNFWRKDQRTLNLVPGAHFYFKLRGQRAIVGRGVFRKTELRPMRSAWETYRLGNGVTSYEQLKERAQAVLGLANVDAALINCIVLDDVRWLPPGRYYPVTDEFFPPSILGAKFFQRDALGDLASRFDRNEGKDSAPTDGPAQEFLEVLARYRDAGVVFRSAQQPALYAIAEVDAGGCLTRRLSATESARVTATGFMSRLESIRRQGGEAPFDNSFEGTAAIRSTYLQSPRLALSADKATIREIETPEQAGDLLCQYLDRLNVDRSGDRPKLYKPIIVACVLEGIQRGVFLDNQIEWNAILPMFRERMQAIDPAAGEQQAAYAYVLLCRDQFWHLAYRDVAAAVALEENPTPAGVREHVRYALIREPFWSAIRRSDIRERVHQRLRRRWFGEDEALGQAGPLDEAKLAEAVRLVIRPVLIDQGELFDLGKEGYHHQTILPRAREHLSPEAITADAIGSVRAAVGACQNLLSRFEKQWALQFLQDADPERFREEIRALLFGGDALAARIRRFFEWAGVREAGQGRGSGFNGTVVSYLLGMSDPESYAFCKPNVYQDAVTALLGADAVRHDHADRIEHAREFYRDALRCFRETHNLPFADLLHVHIAFYVMKKYEPQRGWSTIGEAEGGGGETSPEDSLAALQEDDIGRLLLSGRNVVLYGPPGTGKTYRTLLIAERWRRWAGDTSVEQVTFHPSYSYEDFIEGYRPDDAGKFGLQQGLFVLACERAHTTKQPTLLIIDELNRGDVARLFGELVTLLEPDKRTESAARRLPYSRAKFWVPPNLYVLGTMNTADRSISLMDIAIRRRFCFVELPPSVGVLEAAVDVHHRLGDVTLATVMESLNRRLRDAGIDDARAIGHSYFMIKATDPAPVRTLRERFRYEIVPLISEYCYSNRPLIGRILADLVDERGSADASVFDDDDAFLEAMRGLLRDG